MMNKTPVHYFLENTFVGTGYQTEEFRGKKATGHYTFWSPNSWFRYCEVCGEVWARGMSTHPKATWHALKGNCRHHGGGSIYMTASLSELDNLPKSRELLLHELNLWNENPELYKSKDLISQSEYENDI